MGTLIDLTGKKFGKLTVIERKGSDKSNKAMWLCHCECGNITTVQGNNLRSGHTKSCGCVFIGNHYGAKHNMHGTLIYGVWNSMKSRCNNPNAKGYCYYGAKGIKVCEQWKSFKPFYDWSVDNGYKEGLTLDRIDSTGNYEPSNCRWVTIQEQQRNKSNNKMFFFRGELHCAKEWSEILGINYKTIMTRISHGWSVERVLSTNGDARRNEVKSCVNC